MKNTKKSKILSLLLCGAMILSTFAFLPARVDATDEKQATEATQQTEDKDAAKDAAAQTETKAQDTKVDKGKDSSKASTNKTSKKSTAKTVDFTKVAPFLDPVVGKTTTKKAKAAKSAKATSASDESTRVDNDGVVTSKTVIKNNDGSYRIRLESYVTGASTTTTVTEDVPTDIVLVLDQSKSMAESFGYTYEKIIGNKTNFDYNHSKSDFYYKAKDGEYYLVTVSVEWSKSDWLYTYTYVKNGVTYTIGTSTGWNSNPGYDFYTRVNSTTTKLDALQSAAKSFVDSVEEKATKDGKNVDHRIAVVSYASSASDKTNGFQQMTTEAGKNNVINAIDTLHAKGGTLIDEGISTANSIFESNPITDIKRNRVVIVFTDGAPGLYGDWQSASVSTANNAIANAKTSKDVYKATVYSIGIFEGADASNPNTLPEYTPYTTTWSGEESPSATDQIKNSNRFMHLISSNYPDATDIKNPGEINSNLNGKSYYLSASNTNALNNIFEEISKQIETGGASVKLDSSTVVKDIVSDYFELPSGTTASGITLKTADVKTYDKETKTATWNDAVTVPKDSKIKATIKDRTVSVTGFDFSENYVGIDKVNNKETPRGKKLIVEFNVEARDGFLGGNNVPTNGAESGIYTKKDGAEEVVENFEQPTVNVPVSEITAAASDKNVYLDGSLSASDIKSGITVKAGNNALDLTETNFGLESWQNAFVDISVTVKDKANNDVLADGYNSMNNLSEDNSYTVSASIKAKSGDSGNTDSATGKVNVFKPELTYKDSTAYYGDTALTSYDSNMMGSALWKHGNTTDTDVVMTGNRPELEISYDPAIGDTNWYKDHKISVKHDIPVKATVKSGNKNVSDHVTFKHENCAGSCGFDKDKEQFLIHVKTCSLTVTKKGGVEDEPYVMNIYKVHKDGTKTLYTSMTIVVDNDGNGSETVYELPVGTYTVQEDTNWAWRYNGEDSIPVISKGVGVELSKNQTSGSINVQNHDRYGSYLNGYSSVVKNVFGQKSKSN